jgi:hypothetical protein
MALIAQASRALRECLNAQLQLLAVVVAVVVHLDEDSACN